MGFVATTKTTSHKGIKMQKKKKKKNLHPLTTDFHLKRKEKREKRRA
jgi:hypothetical protein